MSAAGPGGWGPAAPVTALVAALVMGAAAGIGWAGGPEGGAEAPGSVVMHADMELLERFVALPVRPRSAAFEMWVRGAPGAGPGPTDSTLMALLRYDEAGFGRIAEMLAEAGPHPGGFEVETRGWLDGVPLASATREGGLLVYGGEGARRATPFGKGGLRGGVALPLANGEHVLLVIGTS